MSATVEIRVNGAPVRARVGSTVAAAMVDAGVVRFRRSMSGESRAPVCGMGICYECRVTIDGLDHRRSCLVEVADGMVVTTDG